MQLKREFKPGEKSGKRLNWYSGLPWGNDEFCTSGLCFKANSW